MLKFLLTFGVGIYTGLYLCQNYEVPQVDPHGIIQSIKDFADEFKKK